MGALRFADYGSRFAEEYQEIIGVLLKHGANPCITNNAGETPLQMFDAHFADLKNQGVVLPPKVHKRFGIIHFDLQKAETKIRSVPRPQSERLRKRSEQQTRLSKRREALEDWQINNKAQRAARFSSERQKVEATRQSVSSSQDVRSMDKAQRATVPSSFIVPLPF
jgi:hypothetical protein